MGMAVLQSDFCFVFFLLLQVGFPHCMSLPGNGISDRYLCVYRDGVLCRWLVGLGSVDG